MDELKAFLANLAMSEQPGEPEVNPDDVFLYPNGMNAIYSLSESLSSLKKRIDCRCLWVCVIF